MLMLKMLDASFQQCLSDIHVHCFPRLSFLRRRESSIFKAFLDPRFRKDDRKNYFSTGPLLHWHLWHIPHHILHFAAFELLQHFLHLGKLL